MDCYPPGGAPGAQVRLSCLVLALLRAILAPRCHNISQDIQKNTILEPTSSNIAHKTLPRQPPGPSGGGPNPQNKHLKCCSVGRFYTSAIFPKIAKKVTTSGPRTSQKAPKLSPRWPSWRHHGPSWAQLAANLAHLASILGPSSPQLRQKSPPSRARNLKKRPQTPQDHPEGRQGAPDSCWEPNFHDFGVELALHFLF